MRLGYDPNTHRRCICCPNHGQPPLMAITVTEADSPYLSRAVTLKCGHIDYSIDNFRLYHPEWTWDESKEMT